MRRQTSAQRAPWRRSVVAGTHGYGGAAAGHGLSRTDAAGVTMATL
jgi:hypothetical protein